MLGPPALAPPWAEEREWDSDDLDELERRAEAERHGCVSESDKEHGTLSDDESASSSAPAVPGGAAPDTPEAEDDSADALALTTAEMQALVSDLRAFGVDAAIHAHLWPDKVRAGS